MGKVLHVEHGNEWYEINERGEIARPSLRALGGDWGKPSGQWVFLGFAFHHMRNRPDVTTAEIFANPDVLKGRKLWGFDVDHGTRRAWRSPRTTRAYVTEQEASK